MKKIFLLFAAAAMIPTAAFAQQAGADASATGNQNQHTDATAANSVNVTAIASQPGSSHIDYSGHTWTTPNVGGSYFGGTNQCLVGTGVGAAGGPIAISINKGKSDESCVRRSDASAWYSMGLTNVAIARMCQDVENADAFFSATGYACPGTNHDGRYKLANGGPAPVFPMQPQQPRVAH